MAAKRDRERCHWLVLLRNHQPLVALLDEPVAGDGVLDVIASEERDAFEIGGTTVTPGETAASRSQRAAVARKRGRSACA